LAATTILCVNSLLTYYAFNLYLNFITGLLFVEIAGYYYIRLTLSGGERAWSSQFFVEND